MTGIFIWGTGLNNKAKKICPDQLKQISTSWAKAHDNLEPWQQIYLISEGQKSQCWRSEKSKNNKVLFIAGSCSSSLDLAWHFHKIQILPEFGSIIALDQWAGRGRFGRTWHSPIGNVFGVWRLPMPSRIWKDVLCLVVGFIILKKLNQMGLNAYLKWPNDLIINKKKIGGILIEERDNIIMAGIGINLISSPSKSELFDQSTFNSCSLKECGINTNPLEFWETIMDQSDSLYKSITSDNKLSDFITSINEHMAFIGDTVMISDSNGFSYNAQLLGLSPSGYLEISTSSGRKQIISEESFQCIDSVL